MVFLPFISGFVLSNVGFDAGTFWGEELWTIHVLTGEAILLMIVFLFCRTVIDERKCIGCSACEIHCPTGALDTKVDSSGRVFTYVPYQCISCGDCVRSCPEDAVELRHQLDLKGFFNLFSKRVLQSVEFRKCDRCGTPYAPMPQVKKIGDLIHDEHVKLCQRCKEEECTLAIVKQTTGNKDQRSEGAALLSI
jgi:ferredoxin